MQSKSYKLSEVFVPVGLPDITFVKREYLENSIKSWEINQHKHLLIFGASKTGKTSLWKRYIPPASVIKIPCNSTLTIEQLYLDILENLQAFFTKNVTIQDSTKKSLLGELKAIIPFTFVSAKTRGNAETSHSKKAQKEYYTRDLSASLVIKFLKESNKKIVLEDFHYTTEEFRQNLSEDLKAFSDETCPWIIVGVQHKTSNLLAFNIDLSQRIAEMPVENFKEDQLMELIELGELGLNIIFSDPIKKSILKYSHNSASIVQNICQRICLIKKVRHTLDQSLIINELSIVKMACREIAQESRSFYQKAFLEISKGGRSDGSTEKYKWFLKMISERDFPDSGLKNTDVFHLLQELGHQNIDQSSVTAGLKYLPRLLRRNNLPALLDYDESNRTLYLLDNYVKFIMKWVPALLDEIFED